MIVRFRSVPWLRAVLESSLGYRKPFPTFADAQACASKYIDAGHEHPDEIRFHASLSDGIRESDYPVLFYLAPIAPHVRRVFDLGGNVGNLFYSYDRHLKFAPELEWAVYDLPVKKLIAQKLAAGRGETHVRFVDCMAEASGCDVLIASGSLHYFEGGLQSILAQIQPLPEHVFVNRTPFSKGEDLVSVQDNRSYLVPCKLHSRAKLLDHMKQLGYTMIAEWPVHERKFWIPLYPDLCHHSYSGFYFRKDWRRGRSRPGLSTP